MAALVTAPPSGGDSGPGARAEHKQVTVLFADVEGSMAISERLDPEEWYRVMARLFVVLAEGVQRFDGVVNRFTGDGIMALFGAPVAQEDHAQRACHAALLLKRKLARHAAELRAAHGVELELRMGINSGDVVAATLGAEGPTNYTALGQTVRRAALMEQLAAPGAILVSESTAALVEGYFDLAEVGEVGGSGPASGVRAFELSGSGLHRTRLDRSRSRGLLRFVGRSAELRFLDRALEEARARRGAIVGIRGEVGIGKSRLCQEFVARCRAQGLGAYNWRVLSHLRSTPFQSLISDLRRMFGVDRNAGRSEARQQIEERLRMLGGSAIEVLPYLSELLGLAEAPRSIETLRFDRLRSAISAFSAALGGGRAAVVVIDDVQWIDRASARLLEIFIDTIAKTNVLLVMNFRPEYRPRMPRFPLYRELTLRPLGPRATVEVLHQLLGDAPEIAGLAAQIRERTRGNPFFIEELVTTLAETGVLLGARGAFRLGREPGPDALPPTLSALLESRLDRLPERDKLVLQAASVVGKSFCLPLLRAVVGLPDADIDACLASLQRCEFIVPGDGRSRGDWAFRHPLMQEEAYRLHTREQRRHAHATVARACIEVYADALDERAPVIAEHWESADDLLRAARWNARAAAWLGKRNAHQALRFWRKVASLLDRTPAGPETSSLAVTARSMLLRLGARLGTSSAEAQRIFAEAQLLVVSSPDPRQLALLHSSYGQAKRFIGDVEEALLHSREALRIAHPSGDQRLIAELSTKLAYAAFTAGRLREALTLCEEMLASSPATALPPRHHAHLRLLRAILLVDMGSPTRARDDLRVAADVAWARGDVELLAQIYGFEPFVTRVLGTDPEAAFVHTERAVELAEHLGTPFARVIAYWGHGASSLLCGDGRTATKVLTGVLLLARDNGVALHAEGGMLADLAMATLVKGDGELALSIAEEAVVTATRRRVTLYECVAQLARAYIALEVHGASATEEAERGLDRVCELVEGNGTTSYLATVALHRATAAGLRGDAAGSEEALRRARSLYASMGAQGWVQEIDARLRGEVAA